MRKLEAHPSSMANTQGLKSPNFSSWKKLFRYKVLFFVCFVKSEILPVCLHLSGSIQSRREHKRSDTWTGTKHILKKKENKPDDSEESPWDKEAEKKAINTSPCFNVTICHFYFFLYDFSLSLLLCIFHFPFFTLQFFHFHFFTQDLAVKESSVYRHLMSTIVVNMSLEMKSVNVIFEKVTKLRIWENMFANMKIPW